MLISIVKIIRNWQLLIKLKTIESFIIIWKKFNCNIRKLKNNNYNKKLMKLIILIILIMRTKIVIKIITELIINIALINSYLI
jgi:hypothetical protein